MSFDCRKCREVCCNNSSHEFGNAEVSLYYLHRKFSAGYVTEKLLDRMKFEIDRIGKARENCKRNK